MLLGTDTSNSTESTRDLLSLSGILGTEARYDRFVSGKAGLSKTDRLLGTRDRT